MNLRRLCRWILPLVLVARLAAAETRVTVAPGVTGAWVTPDGAWNGRAVLLLHGLASDMDDAGGLLQRLAGELAAHGIASLRINFRGEGDAKRTNIESTLATRVADAELARAFVVRQPGVDAARLGVQGWSMGGGTAILVGGAHPDWFKSMVVWSSATGDAFALAQATFPETLAEAEAHGIGTVVAAGWKNYTLTRAFFESMRGVNVDDGLARYPGAFLTVRGSDDFLPQHDAALLKLARGRPSEAMLLAGADHTFNVFVPGSPDPARVLARTVAWFETTL